MAETKKKKTKSRLLAVVVVGTRETGDDGRFVKRTLIPSLSLTHIDPLLRLAQLFELALGLWVCQ
jgi:hypothetical protein